MTQEKIPPQVQDPEFTIMFYFAGDNPLSPLVVSQIKAIKDAGFQANTEVLVHFDCFRKNAPTRLYRINQFQRTEDDDGTRIGDGNDPFVRNLIEDMIGPDDINVNKGDGSKNMRDALRKPKVASAEHQLKTFVNFCRENYPAKRFMLFLVGHGMIVGSDTFLPDESTGTAITLEQLKDICAPFEYDGKTSLELLALHSCSMSSIEVAYALRGKANFMIASEGISYVGGWPYRQLLKKTFNTVKKLKEGTLRDAETYPFSLSHDLYYLTLHSATDFMLSGFSLDLCLCNLAPSLYTDFKDPFGKLVSELKKGLLDKRLNELIILAHWEAQSYWEEQYTDLYDFCDRLAQYCSREKGVGVDLARECGEITKLLTDSKRARKEFDHRGPTIVHCAENFGPTNEFSRGMSIYFPWSKPMADFEDLRFSRQPRIVKGPKASTNQLDNYRGYDFINDFEEKEAGSSWLGFLDLYWKTTLRGRRTGQEEADLRIEAEILGHHDGGEGGGLEVDPQNENKETGGHGANGGAGGEAGNLEVDPQNENKETGGHGANGNAGGEDGSLEKETGGHGGGELAGEVGALEKETGGHEKPTGGHGGGCTCPSVKNYPTVVMTFTDRRGQDRHFPISSGLTSSFRRHEGKPKGRQQD